MKAIRLGTQQWVVIIAVLVAIPIILSFIYTNEVRDVYLEYAELPRFEREFGFTMKRVVVGDNTRAVRVLVIDQVVPTGIFGRAGVQPGYLPVAIDNSFYVFCEDLRSAEQGQRVTLRFVPTRPRLSQDWVRVVIDHRPAV